MKPKYPDITVKLVGEDGNAFAILGRVRKALRLGNVPKVEIDEFMREAMSNNFDHLIATVKKWVTTE